MDGWIEALKILANMLAVYLAVKIELRWLRRDVDQAHARLDKHDERLRDGGM